MFLQQLFYSKRLVRKLGQLDLGQKELHDRRRIYVFRKRRMNTNGKKNKSGGISQVKQSALIPQPLLKKKKKMTARMFEKS